MLRSVGLALSLAALAACSRPAAVATRTSAPTPSAAPETAGTTVPVHIETNSSGGRYISVVERVTDQRSKRTRITYELRALSSQADIKGSQSVATFAQPHITFNDRQDEKLIADAPQAKLTQRDKTVVMSGGVHARADDGSVLTCDTLRYDGRTEKLHGQGHVVLSAPNGLTLRGNYIDGGVRLDDVRVAEHPL